MFWSYKYLKLKLVPTNYKLHHFGGTSNSVSQFHQLCHWFGNIDL